MIEGINVCLMEAGDAFVLFENRAKFPLAQLSASCTLPRKRTPKLSIVEHRNLCFATPAPKDLHLEFRVKSRDRLVLLQSSLIPQ